MTEIPDFLFLTGVTYVHLYVSASDLLDCASLVISLSVFTWVKQKCSRIAKFQGNIQRHFGP